MGRPARWAALPGHSDFSLWLSLWWFALCHAFKVKFTGPIVKKQPPNCQAYKLIARHIVFTGHCIKGGYFTVAQAYARGPHVSGIEVAIIFWPGWDHSRGRLRPAAGRWFCSG